ncbi:MAG TPA: hypothetical protein PKD19_03245 [Candidatus Saccharibacteria bacterium]|nr:hypothetical protein [Candidatus Saccharibacteria bacterium]
MLHELGHGLLNHQSYSRDIELLGYERDAWEEAKKIATNYTVELQQNDIEKHLDSYRDWLHSRSTCPACESSGLQTAKYRYTCLACKHIWRVNEARTCALRRYTT